MATLFVNTIPEDFIQSTIPSCYVSGKLLQWITMDDHTKAYLRQIGKRGGLKRAKKGKQAISLIAKKGWVTRRNKIAALTEGFSTASNIK